MSYRTLPAPVPAAQLDLPPDQRSAPSAVGRTRGHLTALADRTRMLGDDGERGSQTAEYAMVAGVAAAACAALIFLLTKGSLLTDLLALLVKALGKAIGTWF